LTSNFRRVLNVVLFLGGDSPASEFCADVSERSYSSIFIGGVSLHKIQTPGNHPKQRIQLKKLCYKTHATNPTV